LSARVLVTVFRLLELLPNARSLNQCAVVSIL
jgi:hypothetical protein